MLILSTGILWKLSFKMLLKGLKIIVLEKKLILRVGSETGSGTFESQIRICNSSKSGIRIRNKKFRIHDTIGIYLSFCTFSPGKNAVSNPLYCSEIYKKNRLFLRIFFKNVTTYFIKLNRYRYVMWFTNKIPVNF
jgi:hypothetical protein